MEIMRCTAAFRARGGGFGVGALAPASHPLVKQYPQFFEPVEDYVARRFPEHAPKPASAHTEAPVPKPAARKTATRKPAPRTKEQ